MLRLRLKSRLRSVVRSESGAIGLMEMTIVSAMLVAVLFALVGMLDTTSRVAPKDQKRAEAIREAQVGLHRMTREVRQAYKIQEITPYSVDFLVGDNTHVRYECDVPYSTDDPNNPYDENYRQCKRVEAAVGQPLPAISSSEGEPVVERMLNFSKGASVFEASPANTVTPSFVRVRVDVPARADSIDGNSHSIVLDDGTYLRNLAGGG